MSKRFCRNSPLMVAALFLMAAAPNPAALEKEKREPIVVTSDRMEADETGNTVTFIGGVTLKKETMTLTSDHLVVYYDTVNRGVREIEAQGNVVVRQEGRVAMANKAVYYSKDEKIVLTGEPRIIENENQLKGERITMFMRSERSVIESGNVLFYQDKADDTKVKGLNLNKNRR